MEREWQQAVMAKIITVKDAIYAEHNQLVALLATLLPSAFERRSRPFRLHHAITAQKARNIHGTHHENNDRHAK